jgi:Putative prokaryotic signal transducing protein
MNPSPDELAKDYARMGEDELMELACSYDSLTELAQTALRAEFAQRQLDPPTIDDLGPPAADGPGFVTVRRYRDLSEAIVARSLLESAGIRAYLRDENLVRLEWQISNFIGGIRLQVALADEAAAAELLSQPIPDTVPFDEQTDFAQPLCPRCGSKDITFQGSSRGAALASLYFLSLPLPLGRETWICNACDARWIDDRDDPSVREEPPVS